MKIHKLTRSLVLVLFLTLMTAAFAVAQEAHISGSVENGFRILSLSDTDTPQTFRVYRGDYIKFELPEGLENPAVVFPPEEKSTSLTPDTATAPYFKMKKTGTRPFSIGRINGQIHVIEYQQERYMAMNAEKAKTYIDRQAPFILDVRTPGEYKSGHLENSNLLPVQVLHKYVDQLMPYKDKPILIYCATGNRSTVASKILIDKGFNRIINMRYGIKEWAKNGYKIVR